MADIIEIAKAKVNLSLRVVGRRADGYHELEGLTAFADFGDKLSLTPDGPDGISSDGAFAAQIEGENLLATTLRLLKSAKPGLRTGAVRLEKSIPVAAGLGGGSADAAALLRAIDRANPGMISSAEKAALAARIGSDVSVCLVSRAAMLWGRGEHVRPVAALPQAPALLVNPGIQLSTADVFRTLGAPPAPPREGPPEPAGPFESLPSLISYLRPRANGLEPAAHALAPVIAEVQAAIAGARGCLLARLSGSGATCFGIFESVERARLAGAAIERAHPDWWVRATTLT
ncbi:MAG: 4-(cytidine 5'-diphospho)-2-C-methyl-D-erythritol kinase [Hyphomicrobiaceae bacterium]|nr:4-(cytidine 5'-diphospho)-2-C-methyl-D-erythritol kinase [Hyphomicrobiaceae bacterium]